jgi:hypothetical protein
MYGVLRKMKVEAGTGFRASSRSRGFGIFRTNRCGNVCSGRAFTGDPGPS